MKILTLGNGFVAQHLPYPIVNERIELSEKVIESFLDFHAPDVIVNCIGKTGTPNVDWCETHQPETALANIAIPIALAKACEKRGIHFVHIGSGCIYFGTSPNVPIFSGGKDLGWTEKHFANPKSFYSKTKYACDLAIGDMKNVSILRIRMPISNRNNPRNFINKIRGYKQVIDIPNSVTFMDDLVRMVDWTIKKNKIGIYHVVNPEPITAAQVMREYQKYAPNHIFEVIDELGLDKLTTAKRSNCILNGDKLRNEGFFMTDSCKALEDCMKTYIKNIGD